MSEEAMEVEVIDLQTELQVFDPVAAQIAEVKEKNANLVFDYNDSEGNKNARSYIARLRRLKKPIIETHKLAKAEAKKFCDALDGKKKELIGIVEEMIEVHHGPIWEIEQKEMAEKAAKDLEILQAQKAEEEKARLELEAREKAVADERAALDKEKAEIEQEAREARAALKAKEDAEYQAKQDLEAAENKRVADVQRAKDEATARAAEKESELAREKKMDEEAAGLLRMQERERQEDVEHRSTIHRAIYKWFIGMGFDGHESQSLTQDLIDNRVPNVTINY